MDECGIVLYGNEVLRTKAEDVAGFDDAVRELIDKMYVIMADSRGLGLAAPQIGVPKRVFTYDLGEGPHALVNPEILKTGGDVIATEGCLSIPGLQGEVARAERLTVRGIDESGKRVKIRADGMLARVFQHEIDHLDGTLFVDRADPETLETVSLEPEEEPGL